MAGRSHRYGTGREALLDAAITVVARAGLWGLTYRAVAAEAGVNNSLVAHHFGSRDALITEALQHSVNKSIEASRLVDFVTSEAEFRQALLDVVDAEPEQQAFQFELILEARRRPELREAVRELYETYTEAVRTSLGPTHSALTSDAGARAVFAALDGLMLQFLSGLPRADVEASITALWDLIETWRVHHLDTAHATATRIGAQGGT